MALATIFKNINDTKHPLYRGVLQLLERIKLGKSNQPIQAIRLESDKEKRNELKKNLPCVCWSGKFKDRNNNSLLVHSGFICLDFDGVVDEATFRDDLKQFPYIFAAWISPSGNGVKALVRIPVDNHLGSFLAIQKEHPEIDNACKDVARVCYESADRNIWINEEAEVFDKQIVIEHKTYNPLDNPELDHYTIYNHIKKWLGNQNENFVEGNRNNYICKIMSACNRFGIPQMMAESFVGNDFVAGSNFKVKEMEAVSRSVYGRYKHQFGQAEFSKKDEVVDIKSHEVISKDIIDFTIPPRDFIFLDDVRADMVKQFIDGIEKGETTYYRELDHAFRWNRGDLNIFYGEANHGKTAMLFQLLMKKATHESKRFALFSPEQYPPYNFYNDLIQMYVGKSVMNGDNKMSLKEYNNGMDFVKEHFYYLYPKNDDSSPQYIMDRFTESIIKKKVDGTVIDPWNQLDHEMGRYRDDQYLSKCLKGFKKFGLENDIYNVIVMHTNANVQKSADGEILMPNYGDCIEGGKMTGKKVDNILCYNRPKYVNSPFDPSCVLASQKIKNQARNGIPNKVEFSYNREKFRFVEKNDMEEELDFSTVAMPQNVIDNDAGGAARRARINNDDIPF